MKKTSIHMVDERRNTPTLTRNDVVPYKVKDPIVGIGESGRKYSFYENGLIIEEEINFPEREKIYAACVKFRNLLFRLLDEDHLPVIIHISVFKKGGDGEISD